MSSVRATFQAFTMDLEKRSNEVVRLMWIQPFWRWHVASSFWRRNFRITIPSQWHDHSATVLHWEHVVNLSRLRRESRLNIISEVYLAALTLTIYYVCCILVARLPITLSSTALRQELKKRGEHSVDNVMISARHMWCNGVCEVDTTTRFLLSVLQTESFEKWSRRLVWPKHYDSVNAPVPYAVTYIIYLFRLWIGVGYA
jgi:hypothetical protein